MDVHGLKPVTTGTLSVELVEVLRSAILDGVLRPGERLNETEVAEQLGVSRGPLREAIRKLEREGLLEYRARRGCFVRKMSKRDAYEVYTLRAHLEALAVELALANLTDGDIVALRQDVERMKETARAGQIADMIGADLAFHGRICRLADHAHLFQAWERLNTHVALLTVNILNKRVSTPKDVGPRHEILVGAIELRDVQRVKEALLDHYATLGARLVSSLD